MGFGRRASRFCVTAKLGHLWDKKMQTTILAEKSENPAMEGRVSYLNNLQQSLGKGLEKADKSKAGTKALGPYTSF